MPKPGGRGGKRSHKGQKRHFTSEDEIRAQQEKEEKERAWRKQRGIESDESDDEEEGASRRPRATQGAPGELPPSDSEEESSEEESDKHKGVEHLIEIQNPNRSGNRQTKKISELNEDGATQLSRREREEIAKQQAAARYRKLHLEGKTEEAQADLARLALIRKQREEAAKRREEEMKAKAAKEAQKKAANK